MSYNEDLITAKTKAVKFLEKVLDKVENEVLIQKDQVKIDVAKFLINIQHRKKGDE